MLAVYAVVAARCQAADPVLDVGYLPPDTTFAVLVRPAELAASKWFEPVVRAVDEILRPAKLGLSVADIDQFQFAIIGSPDAMVGGVPAFYVVVRGTRPVDWKAVVTRDGRATQEKMAGRVVYRVGNEVSWMPDERTLVTGSPTGIERAREPVDPNARAAWSANWRQAATSPLAALLRMNVLEGEEVPGADGQAVVPLAPLTDNVDYAVLESQVTPLGLRLRAKLAAKSNQAAVAASPVVARALTNLAALIVSEGGVEGDDRQQLADQLTRLLNSTQIITDGKTLSIQALLTPKMLNAFAASARQIMGP